MGGDTAVHFAPRGEPERGSVVSFLMAPERSNRCVRLVAAAAPWVLLTAVTGWGYGTTVMWRKADVARYWAMRDVRDADREIRELSDQVADFDKRIDREHRRAREARACMAEAIDAIVTGMSPVDAELLKESLLTRVSCSDPWWWMP